MRGERKRNIIKPITLEQIEHIYEVDRLSTREMAIVLDCSEAKISLAIVKFIKMGLLKKRKRLASRGGRPKGAGGKKTPWIIVTRHSKRNPLLLAKGILGTRFREGVDKYGNAQYYLDGLEANMWELLTASGVKIQEAETDH